MTQDVANNQNTAYHLMVLNTFCTALQDDSPLVRAKAAAALGKLGDAVVTSTLLAQLTDESTLVRHSVIQALGELGCSTAVPDLIQALQDIEPIWDLQMG